MTFFMEHTMACFNGAFMSKQKIGLKKYNWFIEHKFLAKLNKALQNIELWIFEQFSEWFECKISNSTTNLLQWFDVLYPQKDKVL